LASLKVAIPLLVLLTGITIVGSLFPTPELFWSKWYLGVLAALGLSLLLITLQHAPMILKRKGRNALIGVIATHLGILVVIAGIIYGGFSGFRHEVKLVEGEVTIIPGLPFVIQLDKIIVEEYRQEDYPRLDLDALPRKRQDSLLTLLKGGQPWRSITVAPGDPGRADGIILLPAVRDLGSYFDLIVVDAVGSERTIPVRPWDPPVIVLGGREILTHAVMGKKEAQAGLFSKDGSDLVSLGVASAREPLMLDGYEITVGPLKRYTGMQVYNRPQEPILVLGSILMFLGLVWHFYFRHRDRRNDSKREGRGNA